MVKLAREVRTNSDRLISQLFEMVKRLPHYLSETRKQAPEDKLNHPLIDRLTERLASRIADCNRDLPAEGTG